jgi:hypothetical protein
LLKLAVKDGNITDTSLYLEFSSSESTALDFTKENAEMLRKMLNNLYPDYVVMNDWKNQIFETLSKNLHKEGFDEEQIRKIARAVWVSFDI